MIKKLFLITDNFPFGYGEEFLETEIKYLSKRFDKINIISFSNSTDLTRKVPQNVKVFRHKSVNKIFYLKFFYILFLFDFWNEIRNIKTIYKLKLNYSKLIQLLVFMLKAEEQFQYINKKVSKENVNSDIYIYSYWFVEYAYAISKLKKYYSNIKVFTRTHGYDLYFERNKNCYIPMKKITLNKIDGIFFISMHGLNYFKRKNLITNFNNKLFLSRLGIDNNFVKKYRFDNKVLNILTCSNVVKVKRLNLLIKALSKIEGYKVNWKHIGDGKDYNQIKKLAENLLSNKENINYKFLGRMNNKEVYNYYEKEDVDLFVNVSASEGIPVSMMEACSFGIPIIATNVGGVPEIVNESNGFLISSNPSIMELKNSIDYFYYLEGNKKIDKSKGAYNIWYSKYKASRNYNDFINSIFKLKVKN